MLLPRPEIDEQGNEVDPRKDLVQKLLEYKRFKEASAEMEVMLEERNKQFVRGFIKQDLIAVRESATQEDELQTLDLYKLLTVYQRVLNRYQHQPEEVRHTVIQYPYTIEEQKKHLADLLLTNERIDFESVMLTSKDRVQLVYSFLAILEMLQQQMIKISVGLGYNNFWIEQRGSEDDEVFEDGN
jgi:segregation and condensation protein A